MTASSSPSWYDVLGVDPDASPAGIRTAWRDGIADLDPGDRRFRLLNDAAEVLLDPRRRSAYDDELTPAPAPEKGPDPQDPAPGSEQPVAGESPARRSWLPGTMRGGALRRRAPGDGSAQPSLEPDAVVRETARRGSKGDPGASDLAATPAASAASAASADTEATTRPRTGPSAWVLGPLALLTALALAVAAHLLTQPADSQVASNTQNAQSAAERAVPVILAYDYRRMDADEKASDALMTPDYAAKYNALFAQLKANSDSTQTVVTADPPLDSGVVRSGDDRVQVLVFVNRSRTNAASATPLIYHDQVRVTMVKSGNDWLVDDLQTSPTAS